MCVLYIYIYVYMTCFGFRKSSRRAGHDLLNTPLFHNWLFRWPAMPSQPPLSSVFLFQQTNLNVSCNFRLFHHWDYLLKTHATQPFLSYFTKKKILSLNFKLQTDIKIQEKTWKKWVTSYFPFHDNVKYFKKCKITKILCQIGFLLWTYSKFLISI